MIYIVVEPDGTIGLPTTSENLDSPHAEQKPDIWMRKKGNIYKYIAVYVDYLAIAINKIPRNSQTFWRPSIN
jgi:hypothetical protein